MPKIDPVTGCQVMTEAEFWQGQAEAEGEGRSGSDLRGDFYDDMERDRKEAEDRYREPAEALHALVSAVRRNNECVETPMPLPVEVLEVLDVSLGQSFRESSLTLRARARREDGVEDIIELESWHSSGTMIDPPDHDEGVIWENLDDENRPIEWKHMYTICRPGRENDHDTPHRRHKVEHLYSVIRKAGVRARIHENQLQYDANKEDETYRALGKYLVNLDPRNLLFNSGLS